MDFRCFHDERSVVTPAGTARAEDPLGQVFFLTKLAEAVPAASIHRQAIREEQHQTLPTPMGRKEFFSGLSETSEEAYGKRRID
ncbi:hypothetical protein CEH05_07715 [Halobacillus halophilus]|nr:hypothetical protein CEH05_07715 [Halobacillus halophilus]